MTVHILSNSLSQVRTTAFHGSSPDDHPYTPLVPTSSTLSPSPMITTCSMTSHCATSSVDVSRLSSGPTPSSAVPNSNCATVAVSDSVVHFSSSMQPPSSVVIDQQAAVAVLEGLVRDRVKGRRSSSTVHDTSHYSESSENNLAANRQLALAKIKADTKAETFNGRDAAACLRWRKALESELRSLDLAPEVRLQMLRLRTSDVAATVVRSVQETAIENQVRVHFTNRAPYKTEGRLDAPSKR